MEILAPIATLGFLAAFIELTNSWSIRSWLSRVFWLLMLAAVGALCLYLWFG